MKKTTLISLFVLSICNLAYSGEDYDVLSSVESLPYLEEVLQQTVQLGYEIEQLYAQVESTSARQRGNYLFLKNSRYAPKEVYLCATDEADLNQIKRKAGFLFTTKLFVYGKLTDIVVTKSNCHQFISHKIKVDDNTPEYRHRRVVSSVVKVTPCSAIKLEHSDPVNHLWYWVSYFTVVYKESGKFKSQKFDFPVEKPVPEGASHFWSAAAGTGGMFTRMIYSTQEQALDACEMEREQYAVLVR